MLLKSVLWQMGAFAPILVLLDYRRVLRSRHNQLQLGDQVVHIGRVVEQMS